MEKDNENREKLIGFSGEFRTKLTGSSLKVSKAYCCGNDDLLSDDFQCVHYRDVTQTLSNRQSRVSILTETQR